MLEWFNSSLSKFKNSEYVRSVGFLMSGSLFAQILAIASAPIITRIYSPEQLGMFTLITTVVSMFGPAICGKYDYAIVLADDEKEVFNLIALCTFLMLTFTGFIAICYHYYLGLNPDILTETGGFAYIAIALLLITGTTNILTSYNNRNKQYKLMATVTIKRSLVQYGSQIGFGVLNFKVNGLLFSTVISQLFGLKTQGIPLWKKRKNFQMVNFGGVRSAFIKYKKQLIFNTPAIFINSSSYSILNFFIASLFGMEVFGYYSLSFRMLGLPLALITTNASRVFFQSASEEFRKSKTYSRSLKNFTALLIPLAILMVISLMFLAPSLFAFFFGSSWYIAGTYVVILAPMYGFRLIVASLTPALIIANKQGLELILQIAFLISSILVFLISKILVLQIDEFLKLISVSFSLIYIIFYLIIFKSSKGVK